MKSHRQEPAPEQAIEVNVLECPTTDGTSLSIQQWKPIGQTTACNLVIVHGTGEHAQRYDHLARVFAGTGMQVLAPDLRGHGRSGGVETHIESFDDYLNDLDAIWRSFELEDRPTAILGHSLGGLIAIRFVETRPSVPAALVLSSPLLGLKKAVDRPTLLAGKIASWLAPRTRFHSRVDPADTTRNLEVLHRRSEDPLIRSSITARWFFEVRDAMQAAWNDAAQIIIPTLALQAGDDRVVDQSLIEPWMKHLGTTDNQLDWFPEHYHEVLNEDDWPASADRIRHWLDEKLRRVEAD